MIGSNAMVTVDAALLIALITIASTLLTKPMSMAQPEVGDVQVMDRANMFPHKQFQPTPTDLGPSIQSPRREEVLARAPALAAPQEIRIPRSEDVPSDEGVGPQVEIVATRGMEIDKDLQVE